MLLRKLNLAPRSALCFGLFCLMIIAIGLIALQQVDLLNKAETYVETTIVPSIKLLGQLDREFVEIKGNNARLRSLTCWRLTPGARRSRSLPKHRRSTIRRRTNTLKQWRTGSLKRPLRCPGIRCVPRRMAYRSRSKS